MRNDLTIQKIHTVFEGEFNPGSLRNSGGRHSDAFCIYLFGKAKYTFDGFSFEVGAGNVFFLARGSRYSIDVYEKTKFICVDLDFGDSDGIPDGYLFEGISQSTKNDFLRLFRTWHSSNACRIPQAFSILYSIYFEGVRALSGEYSRRGELFSKMTSYILDNYTDPSLSISDLAKKCGISEVHVRRIFKSEANITPIRYINFIRLSQAENMLKSSNFTVSEISESVGFSDPFYFSRIFKQSFGVSPSEFRKTKD